MVFQESFSARHNLVEPKPITVWDAVPEGLRYVTVETARQIGITPTELRATLCLVLRASPDGSNWSEYPNIWDEVQRLIERCEWFRVYDAIEAIHARIVARDSRSYEQQAPVFSDAINRVFIEDGIGWQLTGGRITTRGDNAFETIVREAQTQLAGSNRPTAAKHIKDALECLSRRPEPNTAGAVYHAMGSLECVARDITGDAKATLGEILKRYPGLLVKPLDTALSQIWGYASNEARHVEEGREIGREAAQLVVGLSATVGTYLLGRQP